MREAETLKELTGSQSALRKRLLKILKKNPQSIRTFAKEIGISYTSLGNFLNGMDMDFKNYFKIENYVEKKEIEV